MNTRNAYRWRYEILGILGALALLITYKALFSKSGTNQALAQPEAAYLLSHNTQEQSVSDLSPHWSFVPVFKTSSTLRIPRILHQVWDTHDVPQRYENWIRTWKVVNPRWRYWFWTLEDVRELIAKYYSDYLVLYDSYVSPVFRADVMRYFVLHRFGGVYADLDMDAIRPMNNWTTSYDFIVSEESYEHTFIVHEADSTNIVNGFIACRANHPLMQLAIESLTEAARKHFGDYLRATGPLYFNNVYLLYRNLTVSAGGHDDITIVPPIYFLPTYDDSESDTISGKCSPSKRRLLPAKGQIMCREIVRRNFRNEPRQVAYTNHHWVHAYMYDESWKTTNTVDILTLVPSAVLGSKLLEVS